jgi:hypothetical protein
MAEANEDFFPCVPSRSSITAKSKKKKKKIVLSFSSTKTQAKKIRNLGRYQWHLHQNKVRQRFFGGDLRDSREVSSLAMKRTSEVNWVLQSVHVCSRCAVQVSSSVCSSLALHKGHVHEGSYDDGP